MVKCVLNSEYIYLIVSGGLPNKGRRDDVAELDADDELLVDSRR